ncbi:hypothetical protein GO755_12880 [Spirosoma sp. HMF4905]|uniref:Lipocalin-like domain-containing protein n=2 Tax=Spirosoma arboris TaxID=2682092 RepID=A0A7K1SAV0_9BACT|nr:hypothetical protein [Spirosoma arboris]
MKNVLFLLLLGLTIAACSKSTDPTPDAGSQVAGTYTMSYVEADSAGIVLYKYTLPYTVSSTTLAGTLTARRDSANAVFLTQTIKLTGQSDQTSIIGEISLRTNGTGYDMYLSNQKIGTADGKTISIDDQQTDATTGIKYRDILTAAK